MHRVQPSIMSMPISSSSGVRQSVLPMTSTPPKPTQTDVSTSFANHSSPATSSSATGGLQVSPIAICLSPARARTPSNSSQVHQNTPAFSFSDRISPYSSFSRSSPAILLSPPSRALLSPQKLFSVSSASHSPSSPSLFARIRFDNSSDASVSPSSRIYSASSVQLATNSYCFIHDLISRRFHGGALFQLRY